MSSSQYRCLERNRKSTTTTTSRSNDGNQRIGSSMRKAGETDFARNRQIPSKQKFILVSDSDESGRDETLESTNRKKQKTNHQMTIAAKHSRSSEATVLHPSIAAKHAKLTEATAVVQQTQIADEKAKQKKPVEAQPAEDDGTETVLFVGHLPENAHKGMLKTKFRVFGRCRIWMTTKMDCKKYAFITYYALKNAEKATKALHGSLLEGKHMQVVFAKDKKTKEEKQNQVKDEANEVTQATQPVANRPIAVVARMGRSD